MKRPSMQYYPGDWRRDLALQSCSLGARGLWHEMLGLMHDATPYGEMRVGGLPVETAKLARMVGGELEEVERYLEELRTANVFSVTEDGAIYSRRMVRDEETRRVRAECGRLGGNPKLKADLNQDLNQNDNHQDKYGDKQTVAEEEEDGAVSSEEIKLLEDQSLTPPNTLGSYNSPPARDPLATTPTGATRANGVALLQHYREECKRQHGVLPAIDFAGSALNHALTVLHDRSLEAARAIVTAYLALEGDVAKAGWPIGWLPSRVAQLEQARPMSEEEHFADLRRRGFDVQ